MRLGATIDDYLASTDPADLVAECKRKGYRAAAINAAISAGKLIRPIFG